MKNNLKISVITLTLLLAAISFVFSISAAEKTYGDFEYKVENDNVTVMKYLGEDIDVTIPETIDGLPVTSVGTSSFLSKIKIESINLPPTIKYIEYGAFAGCSRLKTINLPEGVIKIDNCAFERQYVKLEVLKNNYGKEGDSIDLEYDKTTRIVYSHEQEYARPPQEMTQEEIDALPF